MIKYKDNSICFEESDLERFYQESGDNNPLHMDRSFGEITVYGEQVVFGMLGVETLLRLYQISGDRLDVKFNTPIFLHRRYYYSRKDKGETVILYLTEHQSILLEMKISSKELKMSGRDAARGDEGEKGRRPLPMLEKARSLTDCEIREEKSITGIYTVPPLQHLQKGKTVEGLCQIQRLLSYLIGMVSPGERALFMKASTYLLAPPAPARSWEYKMVQTDYHDILGLASYEVEVSVLGKPIAVCKIQSYVRADFHMLRHPIKKISQDQEGRTVLVLGGTKGLGAQIAKYYAQRGASVVLTYQHSQEEAQKFCAYLSSVSDKIECVQNDIGSLADCQKLKQYIEEKYGGIDRLYICAAQSPRKIELYPDNYPLFEAYLTQGVRMFYYPFFTLKESVKSDGKIIILSTIAVIDFPSSYNFSEYICVKSVVESISNCSFYKEKDDCQYFVARPSKMLTEMNNTPVGRIGAEKPEDTAEKLARAVEEAPEKGRLFRFLDFREGS